MRLKGRRALVTGGGRGIGRAIVEAYLAEGAEVLACGRGLAPGDWPGAARWLRADVADPGEAARLADAAGAADILVNNAGVQVEKSLTDSTDADWDQVVGINCRGVFNMCRAVIPRMGAGGSIVNIGSISARVADPSMALYNASKAFVHGLTRSIAVDHGPAIRCNAIAPGWIDTGLMDAAFEMSADQAAARADALARHPAARFGQPADVAAMAVWLASDEAAFVTGQVFVTDGGLTAASPLRPGLF